MPTEEAQNDAVAAPSDTEEELNGASVLVPADGADDRASALLVPRLIHTGSEIISEAEDSSSKAVSRCVAAGSHTPRRSASGELSAAGEHSIESSALQAADSAADGAERRADGEPRESGAVATGDDVGCECPFASGEPLVASAARPSDADLGKAAPLAAAHHDAETSGSHDVEASASINGKNSSSNHSSGFARCDSASSSCSAFDAAPEEVTNSATNSAPPAAVPDSSFAGASSGLFLGAGQIILPSEGSRDEGVAPSGEDAERGNEARPPVPVAFNGAAAALLAESSDRPASPRFGAAAPPLLEEGCVVTVNNLPGPVLSLGENKQQLQKPDEIMSPKPPSPSGLQPPVKLLMGNLLKCSQPVRERLADACSSPSNSPSNNQNQNHAAENHAAEKKAQKTSKLGKVMQGRAREVLAAVHMSHLAVRHRRVKHTFDRKLDTPDMRFVCASSKQLAQQMQKVERRFTAQDKPVVWDETGDLDLAATGGWDGINHVGNRAGMGNNHGSSNRVAASGSSSRLPPASSEDCADGGSPADDLVERKNISRRNSSSSSSSSSSSAASGATGASGMPGRKKSKKGSSRGMPEGEVLEGSGGLIVKSPRPSGDDRSIAPAILPPQRVSGNNRNSLVVPPGGMKMNPGKDTRRTKSAAEQETALSASEEQDCTPSSCQQVQQLAPSSSRKRLSPGRDSNTDDLGGSPLQTQPFRVPRKVSPADRNSDRSPSPCTGLSPAERSCGDGSSSGGAPPLRGRNSVGGMKFVEVPRAEPTFAVVDARFNNVVENNAAGVENAGREAQEVVLGEQDGFLSMMKNLPTTKPTSTEAPGAINDIMKPATTTASASPVSTSATLCSPTETYDLASSPGSDPGSSRLPDEFDTRSAAQPSFFTAPVGAALSEQKYPGVLTNVPEDLPMAMPMAMPIADLPVPPPHNDHYPARPDGALSSESLELRRTLQGFGNVGAATAGGLAGPPAGAGGRRNRTLPNYAGNMNSGTSEKNRQNRSSGPAGGASSSSRPAGRKQASRASNRGNKTRGPYGETRRAAAPAKKKKQLPSLMVVDAPDPDSCGRFDVESAEFFGVAKFFS